MHGSSPSNTERHENFFDYVSPDHLNQNNSFSHYPMKDRYSDLETFRKQIQESQAGLHHQPYSQYKKSTNFYKSIFLGFSLLFFILAVTAITLPSALGCGFIFSSCKLVKAVIVTLCTIFFLSSLILGLSLKAEKEAIAASLKTTKAHVLTIYKRKKILLGSDHFLAGLSKDKFKFLTLRQTYREFCDKMNDKKDETLNIVQRIQTAETLNKEEKESLLNQAIEELKENLLILIHSFKNVKI